jgi:hypothetical protein
VAGEADAKINRADITGSAHEKSCELFLWAKKNLQDYLFVGSRHIGGSATARGLTWLPVWSLTAKMDSRYDKSISSPWDLIIASSSFADIFIKNRKHLLHSSSSLLNSFAISHLYLDLSGDLRKVYVSRLYCSNCDLRVLQSQQRHTLNQASITRIPLGQPAKQFRYEGKFRWSSRYC